MLKKIWRKLWVYSVTSFDKLYSDVPSPLTVFAAGLAFLNMIPTLSVVRPKDGHPGSY